jgi:CRP-like cAMP-binding protein
MTLRLTVASNQDLLGSQPAETTWERETAMVIGRGPDADWILPDRTGLISSRHCEIWPDAGSYRIRDLSRNGTFLNGRPDPVKPGEALRDGDRLLIGYYMLAVAVAEFAPGETVRSNAVPALPVQSWPSRRGSRGGDPAEIAVVGRRAASGRRAGSDEITVISPARQAQPALPAVRWKPAEPPGPRREPPSPGTTSEPAQAADLAGLGDRLSDRDWTSLMTFASVQRYGNGANLAAAIGSERALCFLLSGQLRLAGSSAGIPPQRLTEGSVMGVAAFLGAEQPALSLVADGPVEVLTLSRSAFEQFAAWEPRAALALLDDLAGSLARRLQHHEAYP